MAKQTCRIPAESIAYMEKVLQAYINNSAERAEYREAMDEPYKDPYWDMVRELKDDSYMASLQGYQAIPILQQVLKGRGFDLMALGYETEDEAIFDLEHTWDTVKLGMHDSPLGAAVRLAARHPLKFRTSRISAIYQRGLNVAYRLWEMRDGDYIVLPVVRMGQALGLPAKSGPMAITRIRRYAVGDGYLRMLAAHCHFKDGGVATKFQFGCRVGDGGVLEGIFLSPSALEIKNTPVENEGLDPSCSSYFYCS